MQTQELVREECERWARRGVDVWYEARQDKVWYAYARRCTFVAIFDVSCAGVPHQHRAAPPPQPRLTLMQAYLEFSTFSSYPIAYPSLEGWLLIVEAAAITIYSEHILMHS